WMSSTTIQRSRTRASLRPSRWPGLRNTGTRRSSPQGGGPMIYLDHAATTKLDAEVLAAMLPYLGDQFGNASSIYHLGREARRAIDEARELTAAFFGARPKEIVFTSGGSEADNLAIRGVAWASRSRGNHLVTSQVEHSAVLSTCQALAK